MPRSFRFYYCACAVGVTSLASLALPGCSAEPVDERPSILLFVIDTLRQDSVSAYGKVEDSTPNVDALAAAGLRYENAFAPAGWTLPSHATLFTGQGIEAHQVGLRGRTSLDASHVTLAGQLSRAGYRVAGISENPLISPPFGFAQGFQTFGAKAEASFDVVALVRNLVAQDDERPFFLFINVDDPHDPYEVREGSPFLPPDSLAAAQRIAALDMNRGVASALGMCTLVPPPEELAVLRGLYLNGVRSADEELGRVLELLRPVAPDLITIVTSDHGEHLGEHSLLGHEFSVSNVLLSVPLVVHGLRGVLPAVIDTTVGLIDVPRSILTWAGVEVPDTMEGERLPEATGSKTGDRSLFASYSDVPLETPDRLPFGMNFNFESKRQSCRPEHGVFGDQYAITRYPYKLIERDGRPPELYDLSWDAAERSNLSGHNASLVESLHRELDAIRTGLPALRAVDPEDAAALRALGYGD